MSDQQRNQVVGAADDVVIGRAFRWSVVVLFVVGALFALIALVMKRDQPAPPPGNPTIVPPRVAEFAADPPVVTFTDITSEAGIDFVHENGAYGDKLLPETMGGGCAFLDYDNDDDADVLFANSTYWPDHAPADAPPPTMALYRNDGTGKFENVTSAARLDVSFYGTGIAVGDFDNDGDADAYFTALGANRLFRNDSGQFTDVTLAAGVAGGATDWSTSAAFFDCDNDGDLDLFVCNYVRWAKEIDFEVDYRLVGAGRAYGPPMNFEGTHPRLFRNNSDGTFTDTSAEAGIQVTNRATGAAVAKALGVAPIDVDRDGWVDLLIANDTTQNFLFHNAGDGSFMEAGAQFGVAFDRNGSATGAMGIDAGLYRNDGALGFFIGNFANEMTSVYVSQGDSTLFADQAIGEGIGGVTRAMLTFGLFLFDYDLDGRLDLLQANGHIEDQINVVQPSQHYEQPAQLFWNATGAAGGSSASAGPAFVPVPHQTVGDLAKPIVGRGAAYADIDNDGDLDVLLTQTGRAPLLLRNEQQLGHNAIRLRLIGHAGNRDAIGAWIELTAGGHTQRRQVMPTRSYLSQVELPVTFGMAAQTEAEVRVVWPNGQTESLGILDSGFTYSVTAGQGVGTRRPFGGR